MIRIQKTVSLLLPFRPYNLKISHRVLESLGGVSRFLLRALDKHVSLEELAAVTGLPTAILLQQLRFLTQHGFVNMPEEGGRPELAERGARMIVVERLLRDFEQTVWLDTFTLQRADVHLMLAPDPQLLLDLPDAANFGAQVVLRLPERQYSYRHFDEVGRLRRFMEQGTLTTLLEYWWPGADALIGAEFAHWEYSLHNPEGDTDKRYLAVTFESGEFCLHSHDGAFNERRALPAFVLPVLGLTHRYSRVEDFPWTVEVPPASTLYLERLSHEVLSDFVPGEAIDLSTSVAMPVTARADGPLPAELNGMTAAPGLSTVLSVSQHHKLCHIDHLMLSRQMENKEYFRLFSSNYSAAQRDAT